MSSASAAPAPSLESLEARVDMLLRELELALHWQRPSVLFAVYRSEYVRADAALTLTRKLETAGWQLLFLSLTDLVQGNLAARLDSLPDPERAILFVQGAAGIAAEAAPSLYAALERQCDLLLDHEVRVVFWLTEDETVKLARHAPDFWALRHRVVEFLDAPTPSQILRCALETVWQNGKEPPLTAGLAEPLALGDSLLVNFSPRRDNGSNVQFLLSLGILHWRKGDLAQASHFLETALRQARQDQNARLEAACCQALTLLHARRSHLDEAIETCKQALRLLPEQASLWHNLGALYTQIGFYQDALLAFRKATEQDPQDVLSWHSLGDIALQCGFLEEALEAYRKAIELAPEFPAARLGLSRTQARLGRLDQALDACQQALALDDRRPEAWSLLGDLLVRRQQYREALQAYRRVLTLDSQDFQAWNEAGVLHFRLGEFEQAEEAFRQAIALQPQCGWLYANLALVCSQLGRDEEAVPLYRQGIALLGEQTDKAILFSRLGDVCQRLRDEPTARLAYLHAREHGADLDWFGRDLQAAPHSLLHPDEDDIPISPPLGEAARGVLHARPAGAALESGPGTHISRQEPEQANEVEEALHLACGGFATAEDLFLEETSDMACGALAAEAMVLEPDTVEMACGAWAAEEKPPAGADLLPMADAEEEHHFAEQTVEVACGESALEEAEWLSLSRASEEMDAADWNARGNACLAAGSYDEAIAAYLRAIELTPGFAWPYVQNLALAYQKRAEHREQIASQVATAPPPDLASVDSAPQTEPVEATVALEGSAQPEEPLRYRPSAASLRLMEEAWQEDPDASKKGALPPSPLLEAILPTATAEQPSEAVSLPSLAFGQDFNPSSAQEWNAVGNALLRVGAYDRAIAAYVRAIALAPQDGWSYSNLALAYCYQRRYAEAVPLYQKSLELLKNRREKAIVWNRLGDAYRRLNDQERARAAYQQAAELDGHTSSLLRRARLLLLGNRRN